MIFSSLSTQIQRFSYKKKKKKRERPITITMPHGSVESFIDYETDVTPEDNPVIPEQNQNSVHAINSKVSSIYHIIVH